MPDNTKKNNNVNKHKKSTTLIKKKKEKYNTVLVLSRLSTEGGDHGIINVLEKETNVITRNCNMFWWITANVNTPNWENVVG